MLTKIRALHSKDLENQKNQSEHIKEHSSLKIKEYFAKFMSKVPPFIPKNSKLLWQS